jgi:hypothetical protein
MAAREQGDWRPTARTKHSPVELILYPTARFPTAAPLPDGMKVDTGQQFYVTAVHAGRTAAAVTCRSRMRNYASNWHVRPRPNSLCASRRRCQTGGRSTGIPGGSSGCRKSTVCPGVPNSRGRAARNRVLPWLPARGGPSSWTGQTGAARKAHLYARSDCSALQCAPQRCVRWARSRVGSAGRRHHCGRSRRAHPRRGTSAQVAQGPTVPLAIRCEVFKT